MTAEPTENIAEESHQTEHEGENLPNSQNWGIRNQAKVDNGLQKKHMKTSCIVCLKGNIFLFFVLYFRNFFLFRQKEK